MFVIALVSSLLYLIVFLSINLTSSAIRLKIPSLLSAALAGVTAIAVFHQVSQLPGWQGNERVAWTGVRAPSSPSLRIGGIAEEANLRWPTGDSSPMLDFACSGTNCTVDISGGGGFVQGPDRRLLNGIAIGWKSPAKLRPSDKYEVTRQHRLLSVFGWKIPKPVALFGERLSVLRDGREVASVDLPRVNWLRSRTQVRSVPLMLDRALGEWRACYWVATNPDAQSRTDCSQYPADPAKLAEVAASLDQWSVGRLLAVSQSDSARIIDPLDRATASVPANARLDIYFSNTTRVPIRLSGDGAGAAFRFLPPWRSSSPVPPNSDVVVTSQPLPGDFAFRIPIESSREVRGVINVGGPSPSGPKTTPLGAPTPPNRPPIDTGLLPTEARQSAVAAGPYALTISTVQDLPSKTWLAALLLAGWLGFVLFASSLGSPRVSATGDWKGLQPHDAWVICGLGLVAFQFLVFRCALALRYAGRPDQLDAIALSGVTWAFFGLTIVPALIIRASRYAADASQSKTVREGAKLIALTFLLCVLGWASVLISQHLMWPHVSPEYKFGGLAWTGLALVSVGTVVVAILRSFADYADSDDQTTASISDEPSHQQLRDRLRQWIVDPSEFFLRYLQRAKDEHWGNINDGAVFWSRLLQLGAAIVILSVLAWFSSQVPLGGIVVAKEVVVPLFLSLPFVCILLASRGMFSPGQGADQPFPWLRAGVLVFVSFVFIISATPALLGDPGAIFATLALFIPTCIVLALGRRPLRVAALAAGCLLIAAIVPFLLYVDYRPVSELQVFQSARARFLAVRYPDLQGSLLWFDTVSEAGRVSPYRQELQALQHQWENGAMAHRGGLSGLGFGDAPVRSSSVRQDTLQYDSTFSFFVLAEHGIAGGLALLGMYILPAILLLVSARRLFDLPHGLAVVVACAFALEAITQALMNLGVLPSTGRSLPLLSVGSLSDLVRWTILFRVVAQAVPYRALGGTEAGLRYDESIISAPSGRDLGNEEISAEPKGRFVFAAALPLTFLGFAILLVAYRAATVIDDDERYSSYSMQKLLDTIDGCISGDTAACFDDDASGAVPGEPQITVKGRHLVLGSRLHRDVWPESMLVQELVRFNLLTDREKLQGVWSEPAAAMCDQLVQVNSLARYDSVLSLGRGIDSHKSARAVPLLFRLEEVHSSNEDAANDGRVQEAWEVERTARLDGLCDFPEGVRVRPRSSAEFEQRISFEEPLGQQELPKVRLQNVDRPLIGPAWVNGEWKLAVDPTHGVPWAVHLANVLQSASGKNANERLQVAFPSKDILLTLDGGLQSSVDRFTSAHGRERHRDLLASLSPRDLQSSERLLSKVLPPRVGITVMNAQDGSVVALGGWPRMTSGETWERAGQQWIPSYRWIDEHAPRLIRARYQGDRNFDRLLMGSSTKPIWATAVLSLHPQLATQFGVAGPRANESTVFGINISPLRPWHVGSSGPLPGRNTNGWADLTSYMARSDNRYQVLLGFLGLAQSDGAGGPMSVGRSGSRQETMNMRTPWQRVPAFDNQIEFNPTRPRSMRNVNVTPLADRLRGQYGIGVAEGQVDFKPSFWTGREEDDSEANRVKLERLRSLSPLAPAFNLDTLEMTPRFFVSLLLGGQSNQWANVDFAGGFASAIMGKPVVPHVVDGLTPSPLASRQEFSAVARLLRPGLKAVVTEPSGTAYPYLKESRAFFDELRSLGFEVYAKTGTLSNLSDSTGDSLDTSRIVLALVKWSADGLEFEKGLVFSVVIENGQIHLAARWLNELIDTQRTEIRRLLGLAPAIGQ